MIEVDFNDIQEAKARLKAEKERTIYFCDYIKLKKQLEQIEYEMMNNYTYSKEQLFYNLHITSKPPIPFFQLFCCECGVGKTYVVVTKAIDFLEKYSSNVYEEFNRGMLFVMQNIDTLNFYKERLKYLLNNVYADYIDSSMRDGEINYKLQTYPIIFITHQKYKALAEDEEERKKFSNHRKLLIIDEFINLCDVVYLDKVRLEKIRADLRYDSIQEKFDNTVVELIDYFKFLQNNGKDKDSKLYIFNAKTNMKKIQQQIDKIKKDVKDTFSKEEKAEFYNANNKKSVFNVLDELLEYYNGTCILEKGKLYTPKRNLKYWFLEKNIMLDASARLNYVYKLNNKVFKDMLEKDFQVLDHQNWTVELIEINTTSTTKNNYKNFYTICSEILHKLHKNQTLVVTQKKECLDEKGEKIDEYFYTTYLNYFQNMLGDNSYQNLQNVLVAHTFNLSEKQYILEYLYYSEKKLNSDEDIKVKTYNRRRHFENKEIEKYKIGRIANEFYQAIKRVNRDMSKETRVVIITKDVEAVKEVCKMLKNCKLINSTDNYKIEYNEDKTETSKINNDKDIRAIKIFKSILENNRDEIPTNIKDNLKYEDNIIILKKKDLRTELGIEYKENLRREVLNKANVKQFIKENNINTNGQTIIFKSKN